MVSGMTKSGTGLCWIFFYREFHRQGHRAQSPALDDCLLPVCDTFDHKRYNRGDNVPTHERNPL